MRIIKKSLVLPVLCASLALGGCASQDAVEKAQSTADAAQNSAGAAMSAAQKAQNTADDADQKAGQALALAQQANDKVDRLIAEEQAMKERAAHHYRHRTHHRHREASNGATNCVPQTQQAQPQQH